MVLYFLTFSAENKIIMENKDYYTIQAIKQKDGFFKVNVINYGITWAKNIEDIGIALSELIQVTEQREKNFKKL